MCLAVPGKIRSITGDSSLMRKGRVDFGGVLREVSLACVPDAREGDYVIVHAGMALNVLDEKEATQVLDELRALDDALEDEP